jgi:hypothetical protein
VWDAADAPAAAKYNHGEQCTYTENGSACSGTSVGTPLVGTVPAVGPPGETCTSTGNSKFCTAVTIAVPPDRTTGTTFARTVPSSVTVAPSTTAGG